MHANTICSAVYCILEASEYFRYSPDGWDPGCPDEFASKKEHAGGDGGTPGDIGPYAPER